MKNLTASRATPLFSFGAFATARLGDVKRVLLPIKRHFDQIRLTLSGLPVWFRLAIIVLALAPHALFVTVTLWLAEGGLVVGTLLDAARTQTPGVPNIVANVMRNHHISRDYVMPLIALGIFTASVGFVVLSCLPEFTSKRPDAGGTERADTSVGV